MNSSENSIPARAVAFVRGEYFRTVIFYPVLFYSAYLAANSWIWGMHFLESGDEAANALQIERARAFRELLGPYSRFQFHHPGPVSHYTLAWMEPFFPWARSLYAKHALAQSVVNLLFMVGTLHTYFRATTRKWQTHLLAIGLLLVMTAIGKAMPIMVWGPAMIVLPMALFAVASAVFAGGSARALLPMAVGGVFAVHNHIGAVSLLGPVGLIAGILFFRNGGTADFKRARLSLLLAGMFLVITSIPPVMEQFQEDGGNLGRLLRFILFGGAAHRFDKSVLFITGYFGRPLSVALPVGGFFIAAIAVGLALRQWKTERAFEKRLLLLSLVAFGAAVLGAIRVTGSFGEFLFWMFYPSVAVFYLCAALTLIDLAGRFQIRFRLPAFVMRIVAVVAVVSIGFSAYRVETYSHDNTAEKLAEFLRRRESGGRPVYRLEWKADGMDLGQWVFAAGLLLIMDRAGTEACVLKEWEFMFPRDFSCKNKIVSHRLLFRTIDDVPDAREASDRISYRRTEMIVFGN